MHLDNARVHRRRAAIGTLHPSAPVPPGRCAPAAYRRAGAGLRMGFCRRDGDSRAGRLTWCEIRQSGAITAGAGVLVTGLSPKSPKMNAVEPAFGNTKSGLVRVFFKNQAFCIASKFGLKSIFVAVA